VNGYLSEPLEDNVFEIYEMAINLEITILQQKWLKFFSEKELTDLFLPSAINQLTEIPFTKLISYALAVSNREQERFRRQCEELVVNFFTHKAEKYSKVFFNSNARLIPEHAEQIRREFSANLNVSMNMNIANQSHPKNPNIELPVIVMNTSEQKLQIENEGWLEKLLLSNKAQERESYRKLVTECTKLKNELVSKAAGYQKDLNTRDSEICGLSQASQLLRTEKTKLESEYTKLKEELVEQTERLKREIDAKSSKFLT